MVFMTKLTILNLSLLLLTPVLHHTVEGSYLLCFTFLLLEFVDTYSSLILFFLTLGAMNTIKNLLLHIYTESAKLSKGKKLTLSNFLKIFTNLFKNF